MTTKSFQLDSGARLTVTMAPFQDAMALQKAILKALKGLPFTSQPLNMDISVMKDAVVSAITSEDVERALFKCCERAVYNDQKVRPDLFDDPKIGVQAREDFYLIGWHVVEVNCGPFFKKTFSALKMPPKIPIATPV